jgi:beta-glucanase (GH16 family)
VRRRAIYVALAAVGVVLLVISAVPPRAAPPREREVPAVVDPTPRTPSNPKMPVGDLPRWTQTLAEDFSGNRLDLDRWQRYVGVPGGNPTGWFDPSQLQLSNGKLVIDASKDPARGGRWSSGGIATKPALDQTYGKYLVRMRFERGEGVNHAILLWPADNSWPPEIDFSESNGRTRMTNYTSVHYGAEDNLIQRRLRTDLRRWHTVGVEWTPAQVVYTIDGRRWARVRSRHVASQPMKLAIQTHAWTCGISAWMGCTGRETPKHVRLRVDWAVTYALRRPGG